MFFLTNNSYFVKLWKENLSNKIQVYPSKIQNGRRREDKIGEKIWKGRFPGLCKLGQDYAASNEFQGIL